MPAREKPVEVYFTGICLPSPGGIPCFAFVVKKEGETIYNASGIAPDSLTENASNNSAEYAALIKAMEWLLKKKIRNAVVFGDSDVVVKQINGIWRVKSPRLMKPVEDAQSLAVKFDRLPMSTIPRAKNAEAIALAVETLEEVLDESPEMVKKIAPALASQRQVNYMDHLKVKHSKYVSRKEARAIISDALKKRTLS